MRFLLSADTHDAMLFFTNKGRVFSIKCHEIPLDISRISKGTAVVNLFPINSMEKVTAVVPVRSFKPGTFLVMATAMGEAKKVAVEAFNSVRSSGLLAMDLSKNDSLIGATMGTDDNEVIMVSRDGQSIRFPVNELRDSLRASGGVDGFKLAEKDEVVSLDIVNPSTPCSTERAQASSPSTSPTRPAPWWPPLRWTSTARSCWSRRGASSRARR